MEPITIAEAAARLELDRPNPARWLRRYILNREKKIGREILDRSGRPHRVDLVELRRVCPELFSSEQEVLDALREFAVSLEEDAEREAERFDRLRDTFVALLEALDRIAAKLGPVEKK